MTAAMGRPDLAADIELSTNAGRVARMDEVDSQIEVWSQTVSTTQALGLMRAADVPCAPVVKVGDLFTDPHVMQRKVLRTISTEDGEQWVLGSPIKFDGANEDAAPSAPPKLGEHTTDVLIELLDLDQAELSRLTDLGVI
jgi:formyl-CoA transferase